MKNILITGGAGFIGSNFIPYILNKYPSYRIVNLDLLTYAGNLKNLNEVENNARYKFIQGNIINRELVQYIFENYKISDVIHFAAESHVDNSIKNPSIFVETNVLGTEILLEVAYKFWHNKPFKIKDKFKQSRFHHISTDEVYGSLGIDGFFSENTPYAPNSPYSASKAGSDMLVRSYNKTYGLNSVITNCSNNFGQKQHDEKLIPTIIKNALLGNKIPIYGDGKNIRDWLYVQDHCSAIDVVFHKAEQGEVYNIGTNNEKSNNEMVNIICDKLNKLHPKSKNYKEFIEYVEDRPGHDRRYAIDAVKIINDFNWKPIYSFDKAITHTIEWYITKYTLEYHLK